MNVKKLTFPLEDTQGVEVELEWLPFVYLLGGEVVFFDHGIQRKSIVIQDRPTNTYF